MPFPDYVDQKPKMIFFTDFDGTITKQDSCIWLIESEGYGLENMEDDFRAVFNGEKTYRDISRAQFDSIKSPFDSCLERVLRNITVDEHFVSFYEWCLAASVPIVVVSGGMTPIIEALLTAAIGYKPQGIEVIANSVVAREGFQSINDSAGAWKVEFRDESIFGNDKANAIIPYVKYRDGLSEDEKTMLLFAGDGVSDLNAARHADVLFAKCNKDLVNYCKQNNLPCTEFADWSDILKVTKDLYGNSSS